jgi:hypothetical protein
MQLDGESGSTVDKQNWCKVLCESEHWLLDKDRASGRIGTTGGSTRAGEGEREPDWYMPA